jgi:hypothetical protein
MSDSMLKMSRHAGHVLTVCTPRFYRLGFEIPLRQPADRLCVMKLRQNQVWKHGSEFLRIVALERLEVQYKAVTNLTTGEGKHHLVTKKEFCRLIKGATLLTPGEEKDIRTQ